MIDDAALSDLEELAARATPGPWTVDRSRNGTRNQMIESADVVTMDGGGTVASLHITAWKHGRRDARPDARFIARARTALPELIAALRAARRDVTERRELVCELLEQIEEWQDASGLCSPSEERGGDPGGVKPKHLARHVAALIAERDAERRAHAETRAELERARRTPTAEREGEKT